jgi:hypothetical protein
MLRDFEVESTRQSPPVHLFYKWVCRATLVVLSSIYAGFQRGTFQPCLLRWHFSYAPCLYSLLRLEELRWGLALFRSSVCWDLLTFFIVAQWTSWISKSSDVLMVLISSPIRRISLLIGTKRDLRGSIINFALCCPYGVAGLIYLGLSHYLGSFMCDL